MIKNDFVSEGYVYKNYFRWNAQFFCPQLQKFKKVPKIIQILKMRYQSKVHVYGLISKPSQKRLGLKWLSYYFFSERYDLKIYFRWNFQFLIPQLKKFKKVPKNYPNLKNVVPNESTCIWPYFKTINGSEINYFLRGMPLKFSSADICHF